MPKSKETIVCAEYDTLVAGIEEARQRVKDAGAAAVGALFKVFFAEYPDVKAVGWTQYTPHFNDGDACVFGVGELCLSTKDVDFSEVTDMYDEEESGFQDSYSVKGPLKNALGRLSLDPDILEAAFGDHALVIATPAGFHVSEYSHD